MPKNETLILFFEKKTFLRERINLSFVLQFSAERVVTIIAFYIK